MDLSPPMASSPASQVVLYSFVIAEFVPNPYRTVLDPISSSPHSSCGHFFPNETRDVIVTIRCNSDTVLSLDVIPAPIRGDWSIIPSVDSSSETWSISPPSSQLLFSDSSKICTTTFKIKAPPIISHSESKSELQFALDILDPNQSVHSLLNFQSFATIQCVCEPRGIVRLRAVSWMNDIGSKSDLNSDPSGGHLLASKSIADAVPLPISISPFQILKARVSIHRRIVPEGRVLRIEPMATEGKCTFSPPLLMFTGGRKDVDFLFQDVDVFIEPQETSSSDLSLPKYLKIRLNLLGFVASEYEIEEIPPIKLIPNHVQLSVLPALSSPSSGYALISLSTPAAPLGKPISSAVPNIKMSQNWKTKFSLQMVPVDSSCLPADALSMLSFSDMEKYWNSTHAPLPEKDSKWDADLSADSYQISIPFNRLPGFHSRFQIEANDSSCFNAEYESPFVAQSRRKYVMEQLPNIPWKKHFGANMQTYYEAFYFAAAVGGYDRPSTRLFGAFNQKKLSLFDASTKQWNEVGDLLLHSDLRDRNITQFNPTFCAAPCCGDSSIFLASMQSHRGGVSIFKQRVYLPESGPLRIEPEERLPNCFASDRNLITESLYGMHSNSFICVDPVFGASQSNDFIYDAKSGMSRFLSKAGCVDRSVAADCAKSVLSVTSYTSESQPVVDILVSNTSPLHSLPTSVSVFRYDLRMNQWTCPRPCIPLHPSLTRKGENLSLKASLLGDDILFFLEQNGFTESQTGFCSSRYSLISNEWMTPMLESPDLFETQNGSRPAGIVKHTASSTLYLPGRVKLNSEYEGPSFEPCLCTIIPV